MTQSLRLISALLLALMAAAAIGRVALGADTEASVVFTPEFRLALLPALAVGWVVAPFLGRGGPAGWAIAAGAMLAVALPAAIAVALLSRLAPLAIVAGMASHPHALGALAFGAGAAQVLVLRRQSRK